MENRKDYLNREKDKKNVLNIIKTASSRKQNLSFAIDGKWGSGKTFFIDLLLDDLVKDFFVFKYDSWENDFYDEPLIGMLDSIKDHLNRINSFEKTLDEVAKSIIKTIVSSIGAFLDDVISTKTGIKPIKSIKAIKEFWADCSNKSKISDDFNPYNKIKAAKQLIVASMNQLSKIKPIVFIVDEIDRCAPTYTLKIIERIHHISENVDGCITVFSVDTTQLERIIESLYSGEKDTAKGYLRKIIDFTYSLGNGNLSDDFLRELDDYRKRFNKPISGINEEEITIFIKKLFNGIEMRTVIKIINNAKYAHDLAFGNQSFSEELLCAELMLAWATKEYGNDMLTKMGKDLFQTTINKKPFLEYLAQEPRSFKLINHDNIMERTYFNIFDLKSLMAFLVVKHKNYCPSFIGDIKFIPSYVDALLNNYLSNLIKIKC